MKEKQLCQQSELTGLLYREVNIKDTIFHKENENQRAVMTQSEVPYAPSSLFVHTARIREDPSPVPSAL